MQQVGGVTFMAGETPAAWMTLVISPRVAAYSASAWTLSRLEVSQLLAWAVKPAAVSSSTALVSLLSVRPETTIM